MGRKRKNSEELARPRQIVAPVQPLSSRPRRSTKDAFYNNLSTLTATRKTPDEDELEYEEKPKVIKPKKESIDRRKSSSSSGVETASPAAPPKQLSQRRPVLLKQQKSEVLTIPISRSSSTAAPRSKIIKVNNGLHHFIPQLRRPHFPLFSLNIESLSIDPRMQYSCNLCSRRFFLLSELDEHLGLHVENISSCALCEKPSKGFTMEEYTQHLSSHFLIEDNQTTCIFCGEVTAKKPPAELAQHLLYYCPSIRYCFLCETEIEEDKAHEHRKKQHTKLLNRYVCSTCFLGFPSLSPFLSHICDMRYRCLCELTDVYSDHNTINGHIDECEEVERQYHGILVPDGCGRKRCFFVNPHSIMPSVQNIPSTFGFRTTPNKSVISGICITEESAETSTVPETSEIAAAAEIKPPSLPSNVFAVPGTSAAPRAKRKYTVRPRANSAILTQYQPQNRISHLINAANRYRLSIDDNSLPASSYNALIKAEFKQNAMGKPIYRPLKQQPNSGPRFFLPQPPQQQHSFPRVIYPRNHRMVARLLAPNSNDSHIGGSDAAEENIYEDFIPLTKRATEEEENETISSNRLHPSTTSDEEPEVITL